MSTTTAPQVMRVFCAIELPAAVRARVADYITHLRATAPQLPVTWERPAKLHITLKFLGEWPADRVAALQAAAARAAAAGPPFDLSVAGAGAFPTGANPRVLWLGIQEPAGRLAALHQRLEAECAAAGFPRDARAFHAHITLARLRTTDAPARRLARQHALLGVVSAPFKVPALVVMRSDLGRGGSDYTPLARYALGPHSPDDAALPA